MFSSVKYFFGMYVFRGLYFVRKLFFGVSNFLFTYESFGRLDLKKWCLLCPLKGYFKL